MKKVFGFFTKKEEIQKIHENNMKNLEYIYQEKVKLENRKYKENLQKIGIQIYKDKQKKFEGAKRRDEEVRKREEELKRRDEEGRRRDEELKRKDEELKRRDEELNKR